MKKILAPRMTALATACLLAAAIAIVGARQQANAAAAQAAANRVSVDPDDIGGVVNGPNGPEAGVWVIAETTDTPTKYHKIVVSDDQGQFLVPDLPRANYKVWVRGYGLIDSAVVQAAPGSRLALTAVPAPSARAAAQYYPANYWYSLIHVPPAKDFPGTGDTGNGIAPEMLTQASFVSGIKASCNVCHQLGNKATRELLPALGTFPNSIAAWDRRVQSGQDGAGMSRSVTGLGRQRALAMFADWTDRIAGGEVPQAPPRPQGLERNVVVTGWDWGVSATFAHDEVTTDKRNPRLNANGLFYGADYGTDRLLIVDPLEHKASFVKLPVKGNVPSAKPQTMQAPSPYWGDEIYWTDPAHPHNPMMDQLGRVWTTQGTRVREDQPAFCKDPNNPFAKLVPIPQGGAGVSLYDPKTGKVELVDTCFGTHHLNFAEDRDNTLYFSGDGNVIGWLNTRVYDQTKDISKAEGWCPLILDYNGDGKIGAFTLPNEPADPMLDRRVSGGSYSLVPSPVENAVWFATPGTPGRIVRLEIGANPPATCKAEVYNPPFDARAGGKIGYTPRGIDIDRNGVVWTGLASSGHYASFDRRKCKVFNGPTATGQHCQEGWTLYRAPGPSMGGVEHDNSTDFFYTNFVDQFDTLGLGRNVPIANGTASDSLLVLLNGQWVVMRVPYPMGFYSRGLDGRIDDANTGWKGRGVYADYGPNAVWHVEGGKGTLSEIVKFQVRPNPLAK